MDLRISHKTNSNPGRWRLFWRPNVARIHIRAPGTLHLDHHPNIPKIVFQSNRIRAIRKYTSGCSWHLIRVPKFLKTQFSQILQLWVRFHINFVLKRLLLDPTISRCISQLPVRSRTATKYQNTMSSPHTKSFVLETKNSYLRRESQIGMGRKPSSLHWTPKSPRAPHDRSTVMPRDRNCDPGSLTNSSPILEHHIGKPSNMQKIESSN